MAEKGTKGGYHRLVAKINIGHGYSFAVAGPPGAARWRVVVDADG